jgi:hypothetical protein
MFRDSTAFWLKQPDDLKLIALVRVENKVRYFACLGKKKDWLLAKLPPVLDGFAPVPNVLALPLPLIHTRNLADGVTYPYAPT